MLLFQWGTYDWGNGSHFEVNLTRQFIEPEGEGDDAISQLSLTFKFRETPALTEVGEGNLWCKDHGQLNNFMEFINSSTALTAAENHDVVAIEIQHSYV